MYVAERHFKNEDAIKTKIVDGYRRGVCDHNGKTIPKERQGMAGKGSRFHKIKFGDVQPRNVWPRDSKGNLVED